jgi:hypothetical protein
MLPAGSLTQPWLVSNVERNTASFADVGMVVLLLW